MIQDHTTVLLYNQNIADAANRRADSAEASGSQEPVESYQPGPNEQEISHQELGAKLKHFAQGGRYNAFRW